MHLGGWPLHFWPKWVINITKWTMQIYSFWQNSRPQRPKTALFWVIIKIERALFVSFYSISTQDKASFGQSEITRDVFVHTATLQHSKGMLLKQDNLQRALFVFTALYLSTWKDNIGIFLQFVIIHTQSFHVLFKSYENLECEALLSLEILLHLWTNIE